jgi:hypothetical protein
MVSTVDYTSVVTLTLEMTELTKPQLCYYAVILLVLKLYTIPPYRSSITSTSELTFMLHSVRYKLAILPIYVVKIDVKTLAKYTKIALRIDLITRRSRGQIAYR